MQDCNLIWNPPNDDTPKVYWNAEAESDCPILWNVSNDKMGGKFMAKNHFLAGPGKALLLDGNDLIGVATVLQESGLSLSTDATEIRGGQGKVALYIK